MILKEKKKCEHFTINAKVLNVISFSRKGIQYIKHNDVRESYIYMECKKTQNTNNQSEQQPLIQVCRSEDKKSKIR